MKYRVLLRQASSHFAAKSARSAFKREFQERLITYTVDVLNVCDQLRKDRNLWELANQLARSSGSIGANFFEAQGASSRKDYANFFQMALKSANETTYWLTVAQRYRPDKEITRLLNETNEISRIIAASILTLRGKK